MNTIDVSRYEFKYLLTSEQLPEVRRFLLQYCSPDLNAHGEEWYGIHSLYLSPPNAFYRASVENAVERLKLRVRGYTTGGGPVKLEIKRRVGDVISKRSLVVSRHEVCGDLDRTGVWCLGEKNGGSLPFVGLVERMRAAPKVLVTYERHALYSNVDDYVRVTFDRRMACQRMRNWSLRGDPRGWLCVDDPTSACEQYSTYVLELKFKVSPPAWLRDMVRTFGLMRRGFSKYSRSVTRLRIGRDPAWDLRNHEVLPARAWRVA